MSCAPRSPADGVARMSALAAAVSSCSRSAAARSVSGSRVSARSRPGVNDVRSDKSPRTVVNSSVPRVFALVIAATPPATR